MQEAREVAKKLCRKYFKNDYGEPFELTDGQADIFLLIFTRQFPRNQIIASTQYGKSDTVAMAVLLRSVTFNETWAIISGQKEKAQIIMDKIIQHTFDNPFFYQKLEVDPSFTLDRLRRERSKDHINWQGGGGVRTFTANTKNKKVTKEALTGFGSPNIVADEASLIPNDVMSMILRMLGGHRDNFLLKIGNPFYRNHFLKTSLSPKYHNLVIDYRQGLSEGRYTEDFIEEMRSEAFFDVLYDCKFPDKDTITPEGYLQLFPDELLKNAFISEEEANSLMVGNVRLGADFAGGGNDKSAYVLRWDKIIKLEQTNKIADTMQQVPIIQSLMQKYNIKASDITLDYGGLGQGIGDRLHELDIYSENIMFGEGSPEPKKYINMRAYMYYQFFLWIKNGGRIVQDDRWNELLLINYKQNTEKRLQIQEKREIKNLASEMGLDINSPDVADAGALTFADNTERITEDDFDIL